MTPAQNLYLLLKGLYLFVKSLKADAIVYDIGLIDDSGEAIKYLGLMGFSIILGSHFLLGGRWYFMKTFTIPNLELKLLIFLFKVWL